MTRMNMYTDTLLSQVRRENIEEVAKALSGLQLPSLSLPFPSRLPRMAALGMELSYTYSATNVI